jgi:hypothetical protein
MLAELQKKLPAAFFQLILFTELQQKLPGEIGCSGRAYGLTVGWALEEAASYCWISISLVKFDILKEHVEQFLAELRFAEEGGLLRRARGQQLAELQRKLAAVVYSLFCRRSWISWKSTWNSCWLSCRESWQLLNTLYFAGEAGFPGRARGTAVGWAAEKAGSCWILSVLQEKLDFLEEHVELLLAELQRKLAAAEYSLFCRRS